MIHIQHFDVEILRELVQEIISTEILSPTSLSNIREDKNIQTISFNYKVLIKRKEALKIRLPKHLKNSSSISKILTYSDSPS